MTNDCKTCPVSTGTHKPAEAVHQIDEPQADALLELAASRFTVANREARIAELESQLEAIGAGGVEPLRKQAAAPQAVQAAVPDGWKLVAVNPEFDNLMYWLDRCHENGHLEQCSDLIEPWLVFDYDSKTNFATHPTQQGLDALHKQMLIAIESVGSHTVTDCDGDEVEVYFCDWGKLSSAKRAALAAQAKQGGA